jgi:tyrosyl-DNA phosphodiesterase-1
MSDTGFGSFTEGKIYLTCPSGTISDYPLITFKELVDATNCQFAFLTSYCIDLPWILSRFKCPIHLLVHPNENQKRGQTIQYSKGVKISFPTFPSGYGVFHAKLMLLEYHKGLRFVITSANLVDYDYGQIQNILFVQDLEETSASSISKFLTDLKTFLKACSIQSTSINFLEKYNWDKVNGKLVFSLPGHNNTGILMLQRCLKEFEFDSIEYQCSSLGSIKEEWIKNFSQGSHKIVFPTNRQAKESLYSFDTIFFKPKDWESCKLKDHFYECSSTVEEGQALHSKVMILLKNQKIKGIYLGSHNLTPSAWGRQTKYGRVWISNFELGLILEESNFPCPYKRPLTRYSPEDTPWFN